MINYGTKYSGGFPDLPGAGGIYCWPGDSCPAGEPVGFLLHLDLLVGRPCIRNGGLAPLNLSKGFIQLGAEVVVLLLFMLGLELRRFASS